MEILDAIDRPMRPLITLLNQAGLATKWCCCGFPYKDEQEKKSHANYPFIVLRPIQLENSISVINFFILSCVAGSHGWILTPYGNGQGEWHLRFEGANDQVFYRNDPDGIHNYETKLIKILSLTKQLDSAFKHRLKEVSIVDGNTGYDFLTEGEWQVKPHEVSIVKTQIKEDA